jgi:ATP-dependent helicase/nuclease subunit A
MSASAYEINGQPADPARFYEVACDPARSVVVEACAGAGKTWMLVSRIVRAWLEGTPPQQILAITFTRKAAGEMRERLHEWLADFAAMDDAARAQELRIRGVPESMLAERAPRLAQLHAEWMQEGRGVEIHTIHGWFSRLVKAAPLDVLAELSLPPELQLIEDIDETWAPLWGRFLRSIDARMDEPDDEVVAAFSAVLRETGRFNTEGWLREALHNRLELSLADDAGVLEQGVPSAGAWQERWSAWACVADAVMADSTTQAFVGLAGQLGQASGSLAQGAAAAIVDALALNDAVARSEALQKALLTDKGEPRKKLGSSEELAWAQAWLQDQVLAMRQEQAHRLHCHMVTLSRAFFSVYADFKRERGLADMADLELAAARLLCDESLSDWVLQRLDSQVRQLLMDEFQDTSPLQWKALGTWLSAYAGAGGSSSVRVFLVGDPKQSIYRFRRADPRVFQAAKRFVIEGLGGQLLACDHTRRNAPGVIGLLNEVMEQASNEGIFPGFRLHTTASQAPASVRCLPRVMRDAAEPGEPVVGDAEAEAARAVRDTLTQPREVVSVTAKGREAHQVACAVAELLQDGTHQAQDIFVLARTRAMLNLVARALDEFGVPHIAPDSTPLIDTPEVQDLLATVEVLVSAHHDLALAHALRSPLFGVSDDALMHLASLARQGGSSWWDALMRLGTAADQEDSEGLSRAARLLAGWQQAARVLPPHDLLTRILREGSGRERVAATVPPGYREQALFHIDALLRHSLEMDAGRDATPYRWVRALRQSVQALPSRTQDGAVQLLTIHGAKGLEAEVVFLVDTDPSASRSMSHGLLVDWPEGAAHPQRVAFVRSESKPPPALAEALESERLADQREELNALYVALTRARSCLIVSANEPFRSERSVSWWNRLLKATALAQAEPWCPRPDAGDVTGAQAIVPPARLRTLPGLPQRLSSAPPDPVAVAVAVDDAEGALLRALGQVVHRGLELLTTLPLAQRSPERIGKAVHAAAQALQLPSSHWREAVDRVSGILAQPELQRWLDPQALHWAGNEVALSDGGDILRIDRLVAVETATGLTWWVIDYKLGEQPLAMAAYHAQMSRYVEVVRRLQPGQAVHGAFVTGSGQWVPWREA